MSFKLRDRIAAKDYLKNYASARTIESLTVLSRKPLMKQPAEKFFVVRTTGGSSKKITAEGLKMDAT